MLDQVGRHMAAVALKTIYHLHLLVLGLVCIPGPTGINIVGVDSVVDEAWLILQRRTCGAIHRPDAAQHALSPLPLPDCFAVQMTSSRSSSSSPGTLPSTAAVRGTKARHTPQQGVLWGLQEQDKLQPSKTDTLAFAHHVTHLDHKPIIVLQVQHGCLGTT